MASNRESIQSKIIEVIAKNGRRMQYDDIAAELLLDEGSCNALCNELVRRDLLVKPKAGWFDIPPYEPEQESESVPPWDMSPITHKQINYITSQLDAILHADLSVLDTTIASQVIDKFNSVRRALRIPFKEF